MDIKGKEIKDKKVHGKILFAVPIVMLNVITLVFQGVKGFSFDFPASTAGSYQHNDIVPVNGNVRNPAIMIGCLFPVHNPILEKIDLPGVLCAIKRDVIHPMILVAFTFHIGEFEMTFAAHTGELFDPLEENLVVGRLCREDKGHAIVLQRIDKRLFGVKVISGDNDGQFGVRFADLFQNSFPGIHLTVLLIRPITVLDRLWKKGQHLATVRVNDNGLKNLVMIADRPFGPFLP